MPDIAWRTATDDPLVLDSGKSHYPDVSLQVEPGSGSVVLELWSPVSNGWYTPVDAEHTVTVQSVIAIERANRPPLRIRATGDAIFGFFGDIV